MLTYLQFYFTEKGWNEVNNSIDWRNIDMSYNNSRQQVDFKNPSFSQKHRNQYERPRKPWYNKPNIYSSKLYLQ